ncbi:MLP-like protein 423 [Tasmannia lanceolata]|uniref:MLP-like protein 423 n=1 Tax=Tasmannia lanceolata TaxID=3420 RepID=UPI0040637758
MASKLQLDIEVKSSAEKFWGSMRESATLFPKAFPELYKSIEILEGDGKDVGSIRLIKFQDEISFLKVSKEKILTVDEANKAVSYSVIDGDLVTFYKDFKANLQIIPKGDGAIVKWSAEFVKANDDVPDPIILQEFAVQTFNDLDSYLLKP